MKEHLRDQCGETSVAVMFRDSRRQEAQLEVTEMKMLGFSWEQ